MVILVVLKIGIECENLEDPKSRWGIGAVTLNLLEEYAKNSEWQKKYKLYLYFKKRIPEDEVLKNPIFETRVLNVSSFNIFYHIFLPFRAFFDRLDWMFFPAYQLPPLYCGKSVVVLTNDVYYEYKYGSLPFRYKLSYRIFTNWAAKFATKILAISEASKKEVARLYGIAPEKIFVSRLGVTMPNDKFPMTNQTPNPNSQISHSSFVVGHSPYILYVGQAFPRRHLRETIMAFKKIAGDLSALKLIAVGKDKYSPPVIANLIFETNKELGEERILHYDYLEKREDLDKLYSGARLAVYVSDHEAFGLPPVEAASFGVPIVVNESELNHELFDDAAFFSEGGSPDQIAEAIKAGLTDENKRNYCINRYKEIIPELSWKNFADKFFKNLEK